jgi:16S rRNA C967 or C1407 C5-methylase (RsmB/RsmF family)
MHSIATIIILLLALATTNRVSSFSAGVANSAIYILEEACSQHIPVDVVLRRYAKQQNRSYVNTDEYKSLSDVLRNIAISQYRIDWQLRENGVDCTPKNRVAFIKEGNPLECDRMDLQTMLECPEWAWSGLKEAFPNEEDLSKELRALQQPAPLDLRVNTLKCERREDALMSIRNAGYDATSTPWSPIGIRLEERTALGKIPGLLDGLVEPQDEGSQLVASLLQAQPGETVADYCAGSGGKTLQIAASMKNKGRLYSMDVSDDRLERGQPRCKKAGVSNVQRQVLQEDMTRKDPWCKRRKGTFDRVLVDAPCSG